LIYCASTITLRNITLCGGEDDSLSGGGVNVWDGARSRLIMDVGSAIVNSNHAVNVAEGTFIMLHGVIANNRFGVGVGNDGTFNMHDGVIQNNFSSGVSIGGTFNMHGGIIRDNYVPAVMNWDGSWSLGGGVSVSGIFNMHGGIIENNTAPYGGGVSVGYGGTFTMLGGEIRHNHATRGGGGVSIIRSSWASGTFNMLGGEIHNNTADYGGGIWLGWHMWNTDSTRLNIYGGHIRDNHAANDGGAIFTERATAYQSSMPVMLYDNITIAAGARFSGNTAGNGSFNPPSNAVNIMPRAATVSTFDHQINNYDINFGQTVATAMEAIEILGMSMYDVPRMAEFTGREMTVDTAYMSMVEMSVVDSISAHDVSVGADSISARGLQELSLDAMSLSLDGYVTIETVTRFAFDNRNNRISRTVTGDDESYVVAYTYDWNNRLLTKVRTGDSPSTTTFTYDRNGNQLTQTTGNNTKTLHYDVFNHLERVVQGNMTAAYAYRADGLRQSKTVNGHTTTHVWDRGSIILELNDSGEVVNRFSRGLGHLIHSYHHGFYLFNARTDVVQRVDSNGDILHTYRYDAFGNQLNGEETNTNPFRFAGEYYDWETGFIYLRARFYNPAIGRFISEDPYWTIFNIQSSVGAMMQAANLYAFVANNPVMFIDPSGLRRILAAGGAFNPNNNSPYQFTFVDAALHQMSLSDGDATLLVANAGWTADQSSAISQHASDMGINLVWFNNTTEFINYLNTGSVSGLGNSRANDPITGFHLFSHGTALADGSYAITFALFTSAHGADFNFTVADISRLNASAFSSTARSVFYSCRTGNSFNGVNFAQQWANHTRTTTRAASGWFNGRTTFRGILGSPLERRDIGLNLSGFNAWRDVRGDILDGPGASWNAPTTSWFTAMITHEPYPHATRPARPSQ